MMRVLPVCLACLAAAGCAGGGGGADPDAGADTGPELAVDVSCGGYSCARTERGAVECWGGCSGLPDLPPKAGAGWPVAPGGPFVLPHGGLGYAGQPQPSTDSPDYRVEVFTRGMGLWW
ncbi:MAG: hypothetical protein R6V85_04760 [Polyangia bacterium]